MSDKDKDNPFGSTPSDNPFGSTPSDNPFGSPPEDKPFGGWPRDQSGEPPSREPPSREPPSREPPPREPPPREPPPREPASEGPPPSRYPPPPEDAWRAAPVAGDPFAAPAYGSVPQRVDGAIPALVLGILGLVLCPLCAPFAWFLGRQAEQKVDASGGMLTGRGEATAGKILGIVACVLLGLLILGFIVLVGVGSQVSTSP